MALLLVVSVYYKLNSSTELRLLTFHYIVRFHYLIVTFVGIAFLGIFRCTY